LPIFGCDAPRITDHRRVDPGDAPELALGPPEAAHPEHRERGAGRKRRLDAPPADGVELGDLERRIAPGQRFFRSWHAELVRVQDHALECTSSVPGGGIRRLSPPPNARHHPTMADDEKAPELTPLEDGRPRVGVYEHAAGGFDAVRSALSYTASTAGLIRGTRALLRVNQPEGF